jgi:hypothetical protein
VLFDLEDWEQALQILKNNRKIIQEYGSIKLLEQNDILTRRSAVSIPRRCRISSLKKNLLNQFYEITQKLNTISDLDVLIEHSLSSLVEISEADGGVLCLHQNTNIPGAWDYKMYKNFSPEEKTNEIFMDLCHKVVETNILQNTSSRTLRLITTTS